jgi:acyl carrier protein
VSTVEERVFTLVGKHLNVLPEKLTRSTTFMQELGADSLDIVDLMMKMEEEFSILIPEEQAEKIRTLGDAIDSIEREVAQKWSAASS